MKRLLMITVFIGATVLYVFTAALAANYVDLYVNPAPVTGEEIKVKGSTIDKCHTSFYMSPDVSLGDNLYDKNVDTTLESDYYYALSVMESSDLRV